MDINVSPATVSSFGEEVLLLCFGANQWLVLGKLWYILPKTQWDVHTSESQILQLRYVSIKWRNVGLKANWRLAMWRSKLQLNVTRCPQGGSSTCLKVELVTFTCSEKHSHINVDKTLCFTHTLSSNSSALYFFNLFIFYISWSSRP